jgi:membrane protein
VINTVITLLLTALIFGTIFKVLPDAKIRWRDVITGAITTAVLFMLAKFGISFYISKSNIGSTYGAAGSLVILLLWVYFSAMILYFGAEFTKAYAVEFGAAIHPDDYAVTTKIVEVEVGQKSIQEKEKTELKTHEVNKKS